MKVPYLKVASSISLLGLLAACSFAPKYEQPNLPVQATIGQVDNQAPNAELALDWQSFYQDEALKSLIKIALENNRDLRIALANTERAVALYGVQFAGQFPKIGAQVSAPNTGSSASPVVNRSATANLAVSGFELDFWGKLRNTSAAAKQAYLATAEAQKTTQIALIAQLANTYYLWQQLHEQVLFAKQTWESRQRTLALVEKQYRSGVASELAYNQAKVATSSAEVSYLSLRRSQEQAEHGLQVILGQEIPQDLLAQAKFDLSVLSPLPQGLSSDLLLRRPDILAAEAQLKAANANIGVARAAYFPSISLTAALGVVSPALGQLFSDHHRTWAFTPSMNLPIFTAGAISNNVKVAKAAQKSAIASYEKAIQVAFREVADALSGEASYGLQLKALQEQVLAAKNSLDISESRYRSGVDSFLQVQTAQVNYFQAKQALLQTQYEAIANRINLFKALGGGY